MSLTPKQARFVEEYLIDLNATQGAIRAGYSAKTAEVQGSRLLGNCHLQIICFEYVDGEGAHRHSVPWLGQKESPAGAGRRE